MRRPFLAALSAAAALALSIVALAPSAGAAPSQQALTVRNTPVCGTPGAGRAQCFAVRHDAVDASGTVTPNGGVKPNAATPGTGYGPADIESAYHLPAATTATPSGNLVAIVDAYDAPTAEADLGRYRSTYSLPPCTTANGCFTKVGQGGPTTALPAVDGGWAQEISLDLDMVSAACPNCRILLVEANSASFSDLAVAVNYAASQGVVAISNSYGGSDTSNATIAKAYNQHPGIAVTAATGDSGYGVQSPASFSNVVAVGGTTLKRSPTPAANGRMWTESAWSGAGSGCSRYNANTYQDTKATKCNNKADADVSAVADPNTGVNVYDSTAYQGASGWLVFGGTSASSPIIAGVYAQGPAIGSGPAGAYTWKNASGNLNDVTSGSNGHCSTRVWCTAGSGWDGPTGLGTPWGTGAF
ncbi:MAG: hypothetical protein JWO98_813 [Frankiales bacterium]|nr:hypothetical protein [Frankiales bacterium]